MHRSGRLRTHAGAARLPRCILLLFLNPWLALSACFWTTVKNCKLSNGNCWYVQPFMSINAKCLMPCEALHSIYRRAPGRHSMVDCLVTIYTREGKLAGFASCICRSFAVVSSSWSCSEAPRHPTALQELHWRTGVRAVARRWVSCLVALLRSHLCPHLLLECFLRAVSRRRLAERISIPPSLLEA